MGDLLGIPGAIGLKKNCNESLQVTFKSKLLFSYLKVKSEGMSNFLFMYYFDSFMFLSVPVMLF